MQIMNVSAVLFSALSLIIVTGVTIGSDILFYIVGLDKNSAANNLVYNFILMIPALFLSLAFSLAALVKINRQKKEPKLIELLIVYSFCLPSLAFGLFLLLVVFGLFGQLWG